MSRGPAQEPFGRASPAAASLSRRLGARFRSNADPPQHHVRGPVTWLLALAAPLSAMSSACGEGPGVGLDFPPEIMYWDDWDPAWSPDGSEIAIRSNRATRYVPEWDPRSIIYDILHHDLFLLDTLGNAVQVTGDVVDGPYPSSL